MKGIIKKSYHDYLDTDIKLSLSKSLQDEEKRMVVTLNAEHIMISDKNKQLKGILLDKMVTLIPDSISIKFAIRKLINQKIEPFNGIELFVFLLNEANEQSKSLYLFGASKEVNQKMRLMIKNQYPNIKLLGCEDGYISDFNLIKDKILKAQPDLIAVALGVPKQELFSYNVYKEIHKGIFIGVGGSFDILTNHIKRAPKWARKLSLEWLYRIVKEPRRLRRFWDNNVKFIWRVMIKNDKKCSD